MAGRNFLFVPGPTNIPDRVMRAMMVSMEDHRSPKFPELTRELMPGLKKVFRTEHGTPFIFPSSGTGCRTSSAASRTPPTGASSWSPSRRSAPARSPSSSGSAPRAWW